MRGDIHFYTSAKPEAWPQEVADLAIELRTHGPYVHVGVEVADFLMVDATSAHGVSIHHLVWSPAQWQTAERVSKDDLDKGVEYVLAAVHSDYSWVDIADAGLPGWWPVIRDGGRAYDCSHLVAEYLIECGLGVLLGPLRRTPEKVSPNDLARAVGLLR